MKCKNCEHEISPIYSHLHGYGNDLDRVKCRVWLCKCTNPEPEK